jgi:hypothetical protein
MYREQMRQTLQNYYKLLQKNYSGISEKTYARFQKQVPGGYVQLQRCSKTITQRAVLLVFKSKTILPLNYKRTKWLQYIPNGQRIYQPFPFQGPPKFTPIGISGLKINHLATPKLTSNRLIEAIFS